jgi:hypothetical protein
MALQTQDTDTDTETSGTPERPKTWRERHALKVLGAFLASMFALVVIAQVAC